MKWAIKTAGLLRQAWRLGEGSSMERDLIVRGYLVPLEDGAWRVRSREIRDGDDGQLAHDGDWIRLDSKGFPYPNEKTWFEERHRPIEGDLYEQIPQPLLVWQYGDPLIDAMDFILEKGLLQITEDGFVARIWDTTERAPLSHTVVFYEVGREEDGAIREVTFNLVAEDEFIGNYRILPEESQDPPEAKS